MNTKGMLACGSTMLMIISSSLPALASTESTKNVDSAKVEVHKHTSNQAARADFNEHPFDQWFRMIDFPFMDRSFFAPDLNVSFKPNMEVIDNKDKLVLNAEVPGYDENSLDINLSKDALTIKGEVKEQQTNETRTSAMLRGAFSRTVSLPCSVDVDKAQASLKNGILSVTLPKMPTTEESGKRIAIRRD